MELPVRHERHCPYVECHWGISQRHSAPAAASSAAHLLLLLVRLLALAAFALLVSCSSMPSGESGLADDVEPPEADLGALTTTAGAERGVSDYEEALDRQYSYLEDEVLTDEEYQAAFGTFMACANERGAEVEISRVDPESGQIFYNSWEADLELVNECYELHFEEVDYWFQTTNPVVLQQMDEEDRRVWLDHVVPCLTRFGVDVPDHLDGTEISHENDVATQFYDLYFDYVDADSC